MQSGEGYLDTSSRTCFITKIRKKVVRQGVHTAVSGLSFKSSHENVLDTGFDTTHTETSAHTITHSQVLDPYKGGNVIIPFRFSVASGECFSWHSQSPWHQHMVSKQPNPNLSLIFSGRIFLHYHPLLTILSSPPGTRPRIWRPRLRSSSSTARRCGPSRCLLLATPPTLLQRRPRSCTLSPNSGLTLMCFGAET